MNKKRIGVILSVILAVSMLIMTGCNDKNDTGVLGDYIPDDINSNGSVLV